MSFDKELVLVTVVIPTKNAGYLFDSVLKQVLAQETPWRFEVLVVDSGSTDETLATLKRYPEVRLIQIAPSEFGHGKTRNFAMSQAEGEYVAMITQDALPSSLGWLVELLAPMQQDSRIAGVFGRHLAYPDASEFTRNELEAHFTGFINYPVIALDDRARYECEEGYRQLLYFFSDNNAMLRRSLWEKIPYPDVDFAEDQGWARLIIEAGYHKAYAHDAAVFHSHEYGLFERLQRCFDESYALGRLFNYQGGRGFKHAIRNWLAMTLRDWRLAQQLKLWKLQPVQVLRMPLDNAMRVMGTYLGTHGDKIPKVLRLRLSRDRRLMKIDRWSVQ